MLNVIQLACQNSIYVFVRLKIIGCVYLYELA